MNSPRSNMRPSSAAKTALPGCADWSILSRGQARSCWSPAIPALLASARSVVIEGGPHAITWTHADEVNQALLQFIGQLSQAG